MTLDDFNTFITSVEASFTPTVDELKQAVREAGAAHARQLKADMAKPRNNHPAQHAANATTYCGETTRQAYDRCVASLNARIRGTAANAAHAARPASNATVEARLSWRTNTAATRGQQ